MIRKIISRIKRLISEREKGQSVVLIALMLVGLLAFVGLAVDVGFIFVRSSQLTTAVDAAALAGVTEITAPNTLPVANERAAEFLHTHSIPAQVIADTFDDPANYAQGLSILGAREYAITVTWPVELFFLRIIGRDTAEVERTATAAHFPLADIYASRRVEDGALSTSNQAVFGPNLCVTYGDPFSSFNDPLAPEFRQTWRGDATDRTYHYRILVPPDYGDDILRVELFDPDSYNKANNDGGMYTDNVVHTQIAIDEGMPESEPLSCNANQKNPCLIDTQEGNLGLNLDQINLWWFVRIDENRGHGNPPGDGVCDEPDNYTIGYNTITFYELFYYQRHPDGEIERTPLAWYYGQSGDPSRDNAYDTANHMTDMRWVSPGGQPVFDQPAPVYAGCGSPNGGDQSPSCPGGSSPPGSGNGFEIEIDGDLDNILVDGVTGNRYVYMDVTSLSGGSENGYEVWAGPNDYVNSVSSDVNVRNVSIINNPNSHSSRGATVFGIGHLPMNSNYNNAVDIPLIFLGPEYAGTSVFVTHYDSDSGAQPPITFYFDSIAEADYSMKFAAGDPDPDGVSGRCYPGSCGTQFVTPPYEIYVPSLTDDCTNPGDPAQQYICNPFYGGRLITRYTGGQHDTYHWNISLSGLPYLVK